MEGASFWISVAALILSGLSYYFAKRSWGESHRPLVTARVVSCGTGLGDSQSAASLNLVVENSGNRPARNIRLTVAEQGLAVAFANNLPDEERETIRGCFSARFTIPVLPNGAATSNAFGHVSFKADADWKLHSRVPIIVHYEDLDGRTFRHGQELFVADNSGFAGTHWSRMIISRCTRPKRLKSRCCTARSARGGRQAPALPGFARPVHASMRPFSWGEAG